MKRGILSVAFSFVLFNAMITNAATLRVPAQYATIQQALTAGQAGDTIEVSNGTYTGSNNTNLNFGGKDMTLRSTGGAENCIIDCQQAARGFLFDDDETLAAVVDGFTIRNGRTTGTEHVNRGGAILLNSSKATFRNCIIRDNSSQAGGGGMALIYSSQAHIENCEFNYNYAQGGGGGISNNGSNLKMFDCRVTGNLTEAFGGGLACDAGAGDYFGVLFEGNQAMSTGGAIMVTNIVPMNFYNCAFAYNNASAVGGGIVTYDTSRAEFHNCTIFSNFSPSGGNGVYAYGTRMPFLRNCIVYNNGGYDIGSDQGQVPASYCNIMWDDPYPGTGNINDDPLFAVSDRYYLSSIASWQSRDSPCVDAGSDPSEQLCASTFMGNLCMDQFSTRTDRMSDQGTVDMGFHYPASLPSATATPVITPTPSPSPTNSPSPTPTQNLCGSGFFEQALVEEHFTQWPPAGWTIAINTGDCQWESNVTCGLPNYAGYDGMAACCSNEFCGTQGVYRTDLLSPEFDLTTESDVRLEFYVAFEFVEAGDYLQVSWVDESDNDDMFTLNSDYSPYGPGQLYQFDMSYLAGKENMRLQFRFVTASYNAHIMIDRIAVRVCRSGASPTPTSVPPTSTIPPVPTWTPSPAPTPACDELGCEVYMPSALFEEGDICYCQVQVCNPGSESLGTLPVFVILDVYGSYFFAPGFTSFDHYSYEIVPGQQTIEVLPPFEWPADTGAASDIRWYAGITDAAITTLVGNYGLFTFGWH